MIDDLRELVDTESPSRDLPALQRSAEVLATMMERLLGSAPTLVDGPNGPHVHWRGGGDPRVLIVGHHDTVFPAGTVAARPFAVDGDRATGPGVFDMKAGIVQALHGLALLEDRSHVEILITADEEIGSDSSRALIEERALACGAALVLEPSADGGALKTGRKGTGRFDVTIRGRAAHAGLEPEKGLNSILEAAAQLLQIATFADPALGTTVTPTLISGGTADNVVPALTELKVDVRVVAAGEKERLEQLMAGLTPTIEGTTIELGGGIGRPPMPESASVTLMPVARQVAQDLGLGDLDGVAVGGGSDGNFTAAVGVPTLDGLGAVGGGAHADHEFVLVDTIADRAALVAGIVAALA